MFYIIKIVYDNGLHLQSMPIFINMVCNIQLETSSICKCKKKNISCSQTIQSNGLHILFFCIFIQSTVTEMKKIVTDFSMHNKTRQCFHIMFNYTITLYLLTFDTHENAHKFNKQTKKKQTSKSQNICQYSHNLVIQCVVECFMFDWLCFTPI